MDHPSGVNVCLRQLGGLDDIEPVAVEEERVVAEQAVELRDDRMLVGNRLRLELAQRSFDFCVSQSHRTLRSVSVPRVCGTRRPPLFGWLIRVVPAGPVKEFAWRVKLLPADTVVRGATMGRRAGAGRYRQPGPHEIGRAHV